MERLTEKIDERYIEKQERLPNGKVVGKQMCVDKLGKLEDLEDAGRLLKLPPETGLKELIDEKDKQINVLVQYIFNNIHWCPFKDEAHINHDKCMGFRQYGCKDCILKNIDDLNKN